MTIINWFRTLAIVCWTVNMTTALTLVHVDENTVTTTRTATYRGLQAKTIAQITKAPDGFELRIRQQSALATCGYINGISTSPVSCGSGLNCAVTSTFVGCCDVANCANIITRCYDVLGETCDAACRNNPQNLVCPTSLQYCAEYRYEGGSIGLGCARSQGYTQTVFTTSHTGSGTPLIINTSSSSPTSSPTSSIPATGGGLSTGALAGIGVGAGLGVVIAAALIAWCVLKRKKSRKQNSAAATPFIQAAPDIQEKDSHTVHNRSSNVPSELQEGSKSPMSENFPYRSPQPSPGLPRYSNVPIEMPADSRPLSYATTEIGSSRD